MSFYALALGSAVCGAVFLSQGAWIEAAVFGLFSIVFIVVRGIEE